MHYEPGIVVVKNLICPIDRQGMPAFTKNRSQGMLFAFNFFQLGHVFLFNRSASVIDYTSVNL